MTEGEFVLRVWSPGAREPVKEVVVVLGERALDRELLRVTDSSLSRAANAPKFRPLSPTLFELAVPERSARPVVVFEGLRFEALQYGIPPAGEAWKIAPGQLSRLHCVVSAGAVSVALVRHSDWERSGPTHFLVPLPPPRRLVPGQTETLVAPAIVVIGEAAVDVTPADTLVPAQIPRDADRGVSFRLAELEPLLDRSERLDAFPSATDVAAFRPPDRDDDYTLAELPALALELLTQAQRDQLVVPLLEGGRRPRLALAYRRRDDTARLIVSDTRPERFVSDLLRFLESTDDLPARSIADAPRAPRVTPAPLATAPVLARLGDIETRSARFAPVLAELERMAAPDLSILLLGESGTGKEHLARAVHQCSRRATGPFIAVNCSAIPHALIESELFGHVRGAFTGALRSRPRRVHERSTRTRRSVFRG